MKRFLAVVAALSFLVVGCSDATVVDEVTIVNDTDYSANVELTDATRDGWLVLTVAAPHSTRTVAEVIDQGDVWIFRFDFIGRYQEELEVSRAELERNDWTVEVPPSFEQRLHELDVPPPP